MEKGHGSRGRAWASQELAAILISCPTNRAEPPAARPCPRRGRKQLPLSHLHAVVLLCTVMKHKQSKQNSNQTCLGG